MQTVNREDIKEQYAREILDVETHHQHEIVIDAIGRYRWKANPIVCENIDNIPFNDLISLLYALGYDKNSEVYRKLYRDLGYTLDGYWEIFYWEVNNENAEEYKTKIKTFNRKNKVIDFLT
jgi:hypothetical protein